MDDNKCGFCHSGEENESVCGTLHQDKLDGKAVCAHHKCMQYSACLVQYKTNSFGGFKKQEVVKEIKRGSRLICALCKSDKSKKLKKGATSGCAWAACRKTFHYLCVSMNPRTVAKRYRVAAGDKVVILYRVFCCTEHERRYRDHLSADDVVGRNQSSDEGDDGDDDGSGSDDDDEPPAKKSKMKDVEEHNEEGGSGMSSPSMTSEEVLTETQRQYTSLLQQRASVHGNSRQNGEGDSIVTKALVHSSGSGDDVTYDFNTSNSLNDSALSQNGQSVIRNIDEGFNIIIPSKLMADLKTISKKAGYSEETCVLWPKGYNKKGLQDKHMPFVMWNLTNKLSQLDTDGFVKSLSVVSVEQYECLYSLNEHNVNIKAQLNELSDKINSNYREEVSHIVRMDDDDFFVLLLALPRAMLEVRDIWSVVNVHLWTKCTIMPSYSTKQLKPPLEKKLILNWLLPRLHNKSVDLNIYPQEETLRLDHGPKILQVAREVEFQLETISQSLRSKGLVKVLILRKLNRDIVNVKKYFHKLIEQFICSNVEHECYCVIDVLPTDGIHTLPDIIPGGIIGLNGHVIRVFSAFDPVVVPVSCLVVYSASTSLTAGIVNGQLGLDDSETPDLDELEHSTTLYVDVDDTPVDM